MAAQHHASAPGTGPDGHRGPGLWLHRAVRADDLIDALAGQLSSPPLDPFTPEIVAVPTAGVERWLGQSLSARLGAQPGRRDGVSAGIDFRPWSRLVSDLVASAGATSAGGVSANPSAAPGDRQDDPWRPDRLSWPVLSILDASAGQDWLATVTAHLAVRSEAGGRRLVTARRIAGLFDRYARERPEMIQAWLAGSDEGDGEALPDHARWQPELWRRVRAAIAVPSLAERHDLITAGLRDRSADLGLGDRLSVVGLNRIDRLERAVLAGLAERCEVHLWLAHSSPALWQALGPLGHGARDPYRQERADVSEAMAASQPSAVAVPAAMTTWPRRGEVTVPPDSHRLLASLGRDLVEFHHALAHLGQVVHDQEIAPTAPFPRDTLLQRLQADVRANHAPTEADAVPLAAHDRSIQIHACHGPDRQVEVLRDVITGLLAADPSLEPRDIVVMCPDLETFAPLVAAAFDSGQQAAPTDRSHPGRGLRIKVADQSLHHVNPLLSLVSRLVDWSTSRITVSDVVEVCAAPPVANRFGFSNDDIDRIAHLLTAAGVRWGLDAAHRTRFGMGQFGQNTVSAGLDRLLLGVAMSEQEHRHVGLTLPLDEVESGDADLIGRLCELISRLRTVLDALTGRHRLTHWVTTILEALVTLTATTRADAWQTTHARTELHHLLQRRGDPLDDEQDPLVDVHDVAALLGQALAGRPTRSSFGTGSLTLSGLAPMRSVPHRVICLLGMDDRAFPRGQAVDGDDLLAARPRLGDRDRRSEDRQLFLDAVMSAEQTLVVVCSGRDPRSNIVRPPAVPVGDLLDVLGGMSTDPAALAAHVVTEHRLQPYDPDNFTGETPRSFDRTALAGARATLGERHQPAPRFSPAALEFGPAASRAVGVELPDLIRFFAHPIKALARTRAEYVWATSQEADQDEMPIQLDGLDTYAIGERILQQRRSGGTEESLRDAEWRRGTLPPRALGNAVLGTVLGQVDRLVTAAAPYERTERSDEDVQAVGDGWQVSGAVPRVHGETLLTVGYATLKPKHRLTAWLELLALTCTRPEVGWRAVVIGRRAEPTVLGPVQESFAQAVLGDLVALMRTGLTGPLPLPPNLAGDFAAQVRRKGRPSVPMTALEGSWKWEIDPVWQALYGTELRGLLQEPARAQEQRGPLGDPSRFGTLALRLYWPILTHATGWS